MAKVAVAHILDAEIVDNEDKQNGAPFVAPKAGCGGGIVVAYLIEALAE